jgi:hypothetical protein
VTTYAPPGTASERSRNTVSPILNLYITHHHWRGMSNDSSCDRCRGIIKSSTPRHGSIGADENCLQYDVAMSAVDQKQTSD